MSEAAVRVDTTSQVPPYEQIRAQLAALIVTGRLAEATGCRPSASWPPTSGWPRARSPAPTASWRPAR